LDFLIPISTNMPALPGFRANVISPDSRLRPSAFLDLCDKLHAMTTKQIVGLSLTLLMMLAGLIGSLLPVRKRHAARSKVSSARLTAANHRKNPIW
jgi:hypothetical protein